MIDFEAIAMTWKLYPATQIGSLASDWDTLNHALGDIPFLRAKFLLPLLAEFGNGRERLAVLTASDGPVGLAIVAPRGNGLWTTFQPSQLPLGAWLMPRDLAWREALQSLTLALPGLALSIGITQQDPRLHSRPTDTDRVHTLNYVQTA
jgi:hypothetical protein